MQHKMFTKILMVLALACSTISTAFAFDTNKYQVEIIVFSHLDKQSLNAEQWPTINPSIAIPDNAINLSLIDNQVAVNTDINQDLSTPQLQLLPPKQLKLNKVASKIGTTSNFTVIAHIGWIQDFSQNSAMLPLHLQASLSDNSQSFNSVIRLRRQHFFNSNYQIILATNDDSFKSILNKDNMANSQNGTSYFVLQQNRRMRSNELNYIDNPVMGILIEIFPILDQSKDNAN